MFCPVIESLVWCRQTLTFCRHTRVSTNPVEMSVPMPCLNEAATIETCIARAQASMARLGIRGETWLTRAGRTRRRLILSRSVNFLFLRRLGSGSGRASNCRGHPAPARSFCAARNRSDRDDSQTEATVEVDGRAVVTRGLALGEFELRAPVSGSKTSSRVDLILSPTQVLPNGDGRAASGRLSEVELVPGASE